jgi:hypothetical protein
MQIAISAMELLTAARNMLWIRRAMNNFPRETGNDTDPTLPNRAVLIEPPMAIIWSGGG